jgi:glycosyltransferase involved in cell wall biosynthesis
MRLVYVSPVPWDSFAQRPHKFVEWFQKRTGCEVLWLNPYPTRFPKVSDFKRLSGDQKSTGNPRPDWLTVLQTKALPIEPLFGSGRVNQIFWRDVFARVANFCSEQPCIIAAGKPSELAIQLIKRNPNAHSLYDAMDDFPAFYSSISRLSMENREKQMVALADTLWVSSSELKKRWQEYKPTLELIYNGLDPAVIPSTANPDIQKVGKVFGYVGTIGEWFDWQLVIEIAKARPMDQVRLIGPMHVSPPQRLPSNVELHPPCNHKEALQRMREFDVGLIPFIQNDLTISVDPIKYYEYRAIGLPVISSNFGEMIYRSDCEGVFISGAFEGLEKLTRKALAYELPGDDSEGFIEMNAWDARFDGAALAKTILLKESV